jgi:valyl-tRNA synthetase
MSTQTPTTGAASTELPKAYDPAAVEPLVYQTWMDEKAFVADPAAPGESYSIVIPPPNVTGALHLGHAINNTLQDILTRRARMQGKNALWVPGIDHAGIATQAVVEKQLKEKENKTRHDVGREGLVERIWQWKQQYGDRIIMQLQRLGCSCDWSRTRFTLDEICARAVRETFFKLFKDGLIYRGKRLVNWDIHLQTSISDDEIYHETVKTNLWHLKYPIVDGDGQKSSATENTKNADGNPSESSSVSSVSSVAEHDRPKFMTVATTRPETMLGDTAVAVHSEDPRWNWAIGKHVKLPLTDRLIPIIADDILVDPTFGSGVVKVTPAHDPNDYAVYQRHLGKPDQIDLINILNPDGRLNENAGTYAGMKRDAARQKVVADLEAQGLLAKTEPYETEVGHSDRSKTPVEPYLSDQWFVKMAPLAEPALEVVRNGTIKFFPERHAQQYLSWLGEKRDWPISRQLWWGHRIPVWSATFGERATAEQFLSFIEKLAAFKGLTHEICARLDVERGTVAVSARNAQAGTLLDSVSKWFENSTSSVSADVPTQLQNEVRRLRDAATFALQQDPDVLDTWFSSALWPHSTLGWPEQTADLKRYYPTSVLMTGRDIITLWVARMVMTGLYNMGQIPFHHVAINPTILDGKGERMSKSKGNGVDPVDVIETHGADALRFTLSTMATETQDVRMPVKRLPDGRNTSDKFDVGRNFCNKLWNASRFAFANLATIPQEPVDETKWSLADRWIVSRFNRTVDEANQAIESYRFDQYAKVCYDFFWRDFCDWYVEAVKPAMKDPARAGQTANVLAACLDGSLRLMHPMIPYITERLWWALNDIRPTRTLPGRIDYSSPTRPLAGSPVRLIKAPWPTVGAFSESAEHVFPGIQEIVSAIRNLRNEHKVDQKKPVAVSIAAPPEAAQQITENQELVELLGTCTIKQIAPGLPQPANSTRALVAGCEIFVEGLVDPNAEQARMGKHREDLEKKRAALKGRLENPGYIAKAPPKLVEETKAELATVEAELAKL